MPVFRRLMLFGIQRIHRRRRQFVAGIPCAKPSRSTQLIEWFAKLNLSQLRRPFGDEHRPDPVGRLSQIVRDKGHTVGPRPARSLALSNSTCFSSPFWRRGRCSSTVADHERPTPG